MAAASQRTFRIELGTAVTPLDYVQMLTDMAEKLGPALGWRPAG